MDTCPPETRSTGEVAEELGVSVPTVHRALRRLGRQPEATAGGRLRLDRDDVAALRAEVGAIPRVLGFTRGELQVLVAAARAPAGFRSIRGVARAARISPTSAARYVARLVDLGLLLHTRATFAEGEAVVGDLWRLDVTHPRWLSELEPKLRRAALPDRPEISRPAQRLPRRLWHIFWNAEPAKLEPSGADAAYVAERLLTAGGREGVAWAVRRSPSEALRQVARLRSLSPQMRALALNAAAAR